MSVSGDTSKLQAWQWICGGRAQKPVRGASSSSRNWPCTRTSSAQKAKARFSKPTGVAQFPRDARRGHVRAQDGRGVWNGERCTTVKIAGDHEPEMLSEMAKVVAVAFPPQVLAPKLGARFRHRR